MHIKILGSAAGGGFPQWNCFCKNCHGIRSGKIRAKSRTQSSIAVTSDHHQWLLINASPDIRTQLSSITTAKKDFIRDNPIVAILLLDSQLDHTAGLLFLREGKPLKIYATQSVLYDLTQQFPVMNILKKYCGIEECEIALHNEVNFQIDKIHQLNFKPVPLESNAPPYSIHRDQPIFGNNIGIIITDSSSDKKLFYAPAVGKITDELFALMDEMDCILIDGTFWDDDEMIKTQTGKKRARDMGHLALAGSGGLIDLLNKLKKPRKILIHINNTNPILNMDSPEYRVLTNSQIEVAHDGMEVQL